MTTDTPNDDDPSISIVELADRIARLEHENDELRERVTELEDERDDGNAGGSSSGPLAEYYGFADYVEPAVVALTDAKEPGETVGLNEVKEHIKRETQCSNPKTVKKYAKEVTKYGPFSAARGVGTWTFDGLADEVRGV